MDRFLNAVKLHAGGMAMQGAVMRLGTVTSYDPNKCAVKVTIQPEGVLSGWMPVSSMGVGGVSVVIPPSIGDQVVIEAQEGDAQQWVMVGRLFSNANPPPQSPITSAPAQPGEALIVAASGASAIHMKADGTINLLGNLAVTGSITATQGITAGFGGADQVGLQTHTSPSSTVKPTAGT